MESLWGSGYANNRINWQLSRFARSRICPTENEIMQSGFCIPGKSEGAAAFAMELPDGKDVAPLGRDAGYRMHIMPAPADRQESSSDRGHRRRPAR